MITAKWVGDRGDETTVRRTGREAKCNNRPAGRTGSGPSAGAVA